MQKDKKYFSYNSERDFKKCMMTGMEFDQDGCRLTENMDKRSGMFLLKPLDSFESGMTWDRVSVTCEIPMESNINAWFVATDKDSVYRYILDKHVKVEEKIAKLESLEPLYVKNVHEALLHRLNGRYLFGWFNVYATSTTPVIKKIRIYFPKQSYLEYLPEVFGNMEHSDFLHRYLSIYRVIQNELEERVDLSPVRLLAEIADEESLWWIAECLGLENPEIWDKNQLVDRMKNAINLSKLRGTRKGIEETAKFVLGKDCFVVEQFELKRKGIDSKKQRLYNGLYGKDHTDFTIIVPDDALCDNRKYNQMRKAINAVKPVFTNARLISLQPYTRLDQHTYLGINSHVNKPGEFVLNNTSVLPYNTVLIDETERK